MTWSECGVQRAAVGATPTYTPSDGTWPSVAPQCACLASATVRDPNLKGRTQRPLFRGASAALLAAHEPPRQGPPQCAGHRAGVGDGTAGDLAPTASLYWTSHSLSPSVMSSVPQPCSNTEYHLSDCTRGLCACSRHGCTGVCSQQRGAWVSLGSSSPLRCHQSAVSGDEVK